MSEQFHDKTVFTLYEVSRSIQKTLAERYRSVYWIKAEMNKLNYYSHSGHCYPELVEKKEGKIIAQIKASLWKDDYAKINANFLRIVREPLKEGIKILLLAKISYDPAFGLSLRIIDIDAAFTLGDLEREKQETIARLLRENIFGANKACAMALLPKRIAVISVETSKGYADFMKVLQTNPWGYVFFTFLFPALLQGEKSPPAIIAQLSRIAKIRHRFDAVAIIRGGGGDAGLSCYNDYALAAAIAQFPLPVITGIGHATNETVAETVSFFNAITPTKLAEMLLQKFHHFSVPVQKAQELIAARAARRISEEKIKLGSAARMLRSASINILGQRSNEVSRQRQNLARGAKLGIDEGFADLHREREKLSLHPLFVLRSTTERIAAIAKNISNLDPRNVLKRGFSMIYAGNRLVSGIADIRPGERFKAVLYDGEITAVAESINKNQGHAE